MNAREKIQAAGAASSAILDNWAKASETLAAGGGANGYRVIYDVSDAITRLTEAKALIDAAIATYRTVKWPTDADYEELEEIEAEEARERRLARGFSS